jgi:hypothetical protein
VLGRDQVNAMVEITVKIKSELETAQKSCNVFVRTTKAVKAVFKEEKLARLQVLLAHT